MTAPILPAGWEHLAEYLTALEDRVAALESPGQPTVMYPFNSADLTTINAALYANGQVFCTDLKVPACSNGVHWYRADTGAQII